MPEFESAPGWLFRMGHRFACPECGNEDFNVEADVIPHRFWCTCGIIYTEAMVSKMKETEEAAASVEPSSTD